MTEQQWLQEAEPARLLDAFPGLVSDRQLRLFACACCRKAWDLLTDERSRRAVEMAERYADGKASKTQLYRTFLAAHAAWTDVRRGETAVARIACDSARRPLTAASVRWWRVPDSAVILRDILNNPFRPVKIDKAWLKWNKAAVVSLARAVYEDRAFDQLPILADALEDAGCSDDNILSHCREPGWHARGCWLLDAVLGID
jgi:hypothetical protein